MQHPIYIDTNDKLKVLTFQGKCQKNSKILQLNKIWFIRLSRLINDPSFEAPFENMWKSISNMFQKMDNVTLVSLGVKPGATVPLKIKRKEHHYCGIF
jgi:hypothetical protein